MRDENGWKKNHLRFRPFSGCLGFSPEGARSLPLVREPPDTGNSTTILCSSDAQASISDDSQCDIYLI
jgi:hypothetical protein